MVTLLRWRSSEEKSFILQSYSLSELSTCWNIKLFSFIINCLNGFFTAKYSVKSTDLKLAFYVVTFSNKFTTFSDTYFDKKISLKITFLAEFNSVTITDSFWNYNLLFGHFIRSATSSARWAKFFYFWSFTITWVARGVHYERSLPDSLHTTSIAWITFLWLSTRFAFITFTGIALNSTAIFNILLKLRKELPWLLQKLIHWNRLSCSLRLFDSLLIVMHLFFHLRQTFHLKYLRIHWILRYRLGNLLWIDWKYLIDWIRQLLRMVIIQ